MNIKKIIIGVIVVIVLVGGFFIIKHSSSKSGQSGLPHFALSVNTWVGFGPFWLAQDKGFFKDAGVDVDIQVVEDPSQWRAAMKSGNVDGLGDTLDSSVLSRSAGVPAVIVGQVDFSNGADGIVAVDSIKSVKDLKGKTIAVQRNFVSESWLDYVLLKNGLQPSDVNLVDTEAGAAGAAFAAGKVDVAVTWEPWLSKAKTRAGGHILIATDAIPGVVSDVLTVRADYLKDNPEAVQKVLTAFYRAVEYWRANPAEANELMAKHYNVSAADFADMSSGVVWPTLAAAQKYLGTPNAHGPAYGYVDAFSAIYIKTGQITGQKPNAEDAINGTIIQGVTF